MAAEGAFFEVLVVRFRVGGQGLHFILAAKAKLAVKHVRAILFLVILN